MEKFEEVLPDVWLLKVPFGIVWTGVILVRGEKTFLVDSSQAQPEEFLVPALDALGVKLSEIDWLLNTHSHGDHIGGHHALVTKYGLKCAALDTSADALRDPVKVAIRVRTRFPKNSPPPQSYLKGVEPAKVLAEDELLEGRFSAIRSPGHDDDCVCWYDHLTKTAFTGDSLQANGTPTQGVGFYRDLPAYRRTLAHLRDYDIENLVCGHDYDGIGSVVRGRENVLKALDYCAARVRLYEEKIRQYVAEEVPAGRGRPAYVARTPSSFEGAPAGRGRPAYVARTPSSLLTEDEPTTLALRLIDEVGCGRPASLFLALHTVSEHLKEMPK